MSYVQNGEQRTLPIVRACRRVATWLLRDGDGVLRLAAHHEDGGKNGCVTLEPAESVDTAAGRPNMNSGHGYAVVRAIGRPCRAEGTLGDAWTVMWTF